MAALVAARPMARPRPGATGSMGRCWCTRPTHPHGNRIARGEHHRGRTARAGPGPAVLVRSRLGELEVAERERFGAEVEDLAGLGEEQPGFDLVEEVGLVVAVAAVEVQLAPVFEEPAGRLGDLEESQRRRLILTEVRLPAGRVRRLGVPARMSAAREGGGSQSSSPRSHGRGRGAHEAVAVGRLVYEVVEDAEGQVALQLCSAELNSTAIPSCRSGSQNRSLLKPNPPPPWEKRSALAPWYQPVRPTPRP